MKRGLLFLFLFLSPLTIPPRKNATVMKEWTIP